MSDGLFEGESERRWVIVTLIAILFISSPFVIIYLNDFLPYWLLPFILIIVIPYQVGKAQGKHIVLDKLRQDIGRFPYDKNPSEIVEKVVELVKTNAQ